MSSEPTPSNDPFEPDDVPQGAAPVPAPAASISGEPIAGSKTSSSPSAKSTQGESAPDSATASESTDIKPKDAKKPKKKRSWRRRLVLLAIILLAFALVFRLALGIAFPIVLNKVAASYGLNATYERFSLSLTGGDVLLGRLAFVPEGKTEPFASANYVRATISPLKLFVGKLEVWRVDADGVELNVDRDKSGKMPVIDRLLASAQPAAAKPADAKASTSPSQIDLTSPLAVDGFRLQHLRAHIRDQSLNPPLDAMIQLDVRVDDIGSSSRPTTFAINVYSDPILDALIVEGSAKSAGAYLDADVSAWVKGLHLKPLSGYLSPLGIRPVADSLVMQAKGRVRTTAAGLTQAAGQLASAAASATRTASPPAVAAAPATLPAGPTVPADAKPADALALSIDFHKMGVWADGVECAALDSFKLDVSKLNLSTLNITSLVMDGIRAKAERTEEGNLRAAGIELFPVASTKSAAKTADAKSADAKKPPADNSLAAKPAASGSPFIASLGTLAVKNLLVSVEDRFVIPTSRLGFAVDEFTVNDLLLDPAKPDAPIKIAGAFRAPGIARAVRLDGTATPFAVNKALQLNFTASGIVPTGIQPYLDLVGLESQLKDASFTASLSASASLDDPSGKIGASARLNQISFRDKEELFGLEDVNFAGVSLDPKTGLLKVDAIEVTGPTLTLRREADGSLAALGFRTKKAIEGRHREVPPSEPSEIKLAKVELGKFVWKGVKVGFEDRKSDPPESITLGDAGLEISDVKFDLENKGPPPAPGKIKGWLVAPKIADRLEVNGTIVPTTGSIGVDLSFTGQGITAAGVAGYLKSLGIEPLLKDGSFAAHLTASVSQTPAGDLKAALAIDKVKYADGTTELGGVDLFKIDGVVFDQKANALKVGSIVIDHPRASVLRETEKSFVAAGIRYTLPDKAKADEPASATAMTAASAGATSATVASANPSPVAAPAAKPQNAQPAAADRLAFVATLDSLQIRSSTLSWSDRATTRPVSTTLHADVDLGGLTLGKDGGPADLGITVKIDDVVDRSTITGTILPGPTKFGVSLKIDAAGVRGTALAPYLPPNLQLDLKDGRLKTQIDAGLSPADGAGGYQARLLVNGVDWRDGESGPSLFKLDTFRIVVPRLDVAGEKAGNIIAVDEIFLGGVELDASRQANGSLHAFGIAVVPPPESPEGSPAKAPTASAKPAIQPANPAATAGAPAAGVGPAVAAAPVADARAIAAQARKQLPLFTLNKLDLNLRRFGFSDLSTQGTLPLTVSDLRFQNLGKVELLGKDPTANPPLKLSLTGRADPLIRSIDVQTSIAPFAQLPTLQSDVKLAGINGEGIFAIMPKLREQIDGSKLKDGQFKTHAEVTLKVDRRGPADIDFLKGFDAEVLVKGTEYRAEPKGRVLLGLDELRVEEARVKPAAKTVRIKSIEVNKPIGFVTREKDGIHAVGLVIKETKPPATQPTTAPTPAQASPASRPATAPATQPAATQPAPILVQKPDSEIRIDKFVVSGIDFRLEDNSVDPPLIVPLTSLDLQARDISSLIQYEDKPITFNVLVNAGKVPLPKPAAGGLLNVAGGVGNAIGGGANLLGGGANLLGGGASLLTGGAVKAPVVPTAAPASAPALQMEERELFAQVAASGKVGLYPKPNGYVKANVAGFEIPAIKGEALPYGVTLSNGTFDLNADVRARNDGSIDLIARPSVVDLSVKDSPEGVIAKAIGGGAGIGLDVMIGALESADKSITIPVNVTAKARPDGTYDIGGVGKTVLSAVGEVALKAVAGAPVKVASGVVNMIPGLGGLFAPKPPPGPVTISFAAGATELDPAEAQKLATLVEALKSDPEFNIKISHDLGGGDVNLAAVRANPPATDAASIAAGLHRRKLELTQLRTEVAADARYRLAAGPGPDSQAAIDRLRAIDRDISRTEDALDRVFDLFRPGADRQAPRRTRSASLSIARERLDAAREFLAASGIPNFATRSEIANPKYAPADGNTGGTLTITTTRVRKN